MVNPVQYTNHSPSQKIDTLVLLAQRYIDYGIYPVSHTSIAYSELYDIYSSLSVVIPTNILKTILLI